MTEAMSGLTVDHVAKEFPTRAEPLVVLRDVSLTLAAGQSAAILGPSGSGKSTLLHIVGALDEPTGGTVTLDGENAFTLDSAGLAKFRNRNIGFVFQDHYLLPQLTVLENVLIPALADGAPSAEVQARAKELLARVGCAGGFKDVDTQQQVGLAIRDVAGRRVHDSVNVGRDTGILPVLVV